MNKVNQNNNSIILRTRVVISTIARAVTKVTTKGTSRNILRAVAICILVVVITFCSYANSYENKDVKIGKEILSGIEAKSKTSHNGENSNINIKNYQKELDQNIVQWTKNLESKLNKDTNIQEPISIPRIEQTEENKRLATQITAKSEGLINEALGISQSRVIKKQDTDFLIFVSFSMGEKNVEQLIKSVIKYDGIVMMRGFKEGSVRKTAEVLLKVRKKGGIAIDPILFEEYGIKRVPTYVLVKVCDEGITTSCNGKYDILRGNVSPRYALEKFSIQGELREEARRRLG